MNEKSPTGRLGNEQPLNAQQLPVERTATGDLVRAALSPVTLFPTKCPRCGWVLLEPGSISLKLADEALGEVPASVDPDGELLIDLDPEEFNSPSGSFLVTCSNCGKDLGEVEL